MLQHDPKLAEAFGCLGEVCTTSVRNLNSGRTKEMRCHLYLPCKISYRVKALNCADCKYVSITLKLNFSELSIEKSISLNITSPDNFFTCSSTLVSTASSRKVSGGISLMSSPAVIKQNHSINRFRTLVVKSFAASILKFAVLFYANFVLQIF